MKMCRVCKTEKPLDEFHKNSSAPDGRQYRCKPCAVSAARKWQQEHPEAAREADRKYRQTDKYKANRKARREGPQREHILEQKRNSWYRNHESNLARQREREADPEHRRKQRERYARWRANDPRGVQRIALKNLYGLTLDQWDRMVIRQCGRCAICEMPTSDLHVDHCHVSGKVRALLCANCNRALGLLKDDPSLMRAAARYVVKHKPKVPSQRSNPD